MSQTIVVTMVLKGKHINVHSKHSKASHRAVKFWLASLSKVWTHWKVLKIVVWLKCTKVIISTNLLWIQLLMIQVQMLHLDLRWFKRNFELITPTRIVTYRAVLKLIVKHHTVLAKQCHLPNHLRDSSDAMINPIIWIKRLVMLPAIRFLR